MNLVKTEKRTPSQQRGLQRFNSILDALALLIREGGSAQVTTQAVSKASQASVGSLYHFFSSREDMLEALAQRHIGKIALVLEEIENLSDQQWCAFSPAEAIERLVGPIFSYLSQNWDFYIIANALPYFPEFTEKGILAQLYTLHERMVELRCRTLSPDDIALHAKVLLKLPKGLLEEFNLRPDPRLLKQAKFALTTYLQNIEP
jgi:AcrR family transcriptional regulator